MLSEIDESQSQDNATDARPTDSAAFCLSSVRLPAAAKGTLIQRVLNKVPNLSYSVSFTTRAPRSGEVDGREYFFVTPEKFEEMVAANEFLEWAHVHGKLYGTSRQQVSREISEGRDIILEVEFRAQPAYER